MPPARIAAASSFLSFRSPWLNFGSCPRIATVRRSATTFPLADSRSSRPATSASLARSGRAADRWTRGSPTGGGEPRAAGPRREGLGPPARRRYPSRTRTVRLGPRGSSTRAPEAASVARPESTWSTARPVRAQRRRSVQVVRPRKANAAPRRSSGSAEPNRPSRSIDELVAAPVAPRPGLNDPATPQRGRRTLVAEHERLSKHRDNRLGDEELRELRDAGASLVVSPAARARSRPRLFPGGAYNARGVARGGAASSDPTTSTERIRVD